MGNADSTVENDIAIVNLQEALSRHEDSKAEKYATGPTIGMSHMAFHADTMLVGLMVSGGAVMLIYLVYNCLKTGKCCPAVLTDAIRYKSDIRYRGRMRFRRGEDEEARMTPLPRLTPLMIYDGGRMVAGGESPAVGYHTCAAPKVANYPAASAGPQVPSCPSCPSSEQQKGKQFYQVRPGMSEGLFT